MPLLRPNPVGGRNSMSLSRVAYAFLDRAKPAPLLDYRAVPPGVANFLLEHVDALAKLAKESHPVAHFGSSAARSSFELLRGGDADRFLSAARGMCDAVHREMVKKPAAQAGFLVFVHASDQRVMTCRLPAAQS